MYYEISKSYLVRINFFFLPIITPILQFGFNHAQDIRQPTVSLTMAVTLIFNCNLKLLFVIFMFRRIQVNG